ncbi:hypothetical protein BGX27_002445 [Mortierella sp. AM989]|nr:hypothetical protein BGX27_002445 [Mortierella sp. AM989]
MAFDRRTTSSSRPRTLSTSSSTSSITSSPKKAFSKSSWATTHRDRPGWLDTTISASAKSKEPYDDHCHNFRPIPESPPSSPLPLDFHKASDIDSEDDTLYQHHSHHHHHDKRPQTLTQRKRADSESADENPTFASNIKNCYSHECSQSPITPTIGRRNSSIKLTPCNSESDKSKSKELSRPLKKQMSPSTVGGTAATTATVATTAAASDVKSRPRFTFSTNVNPRSRVCTTTRSTVPASTTTSPSASISPKIKQPKSDARDNKSSVSETTFREEIEPSKTVSTTRLLTKSRSPTTITMSTTRRVVSTTINVDGQNGDINRRKESTITTTVVAAKKGNLGLGLTGCGLAYNRNERFGRHHRVKSPSTLPVTAAGSAATCGKDRERTKLSMKSEGAKTGKEEWKEKKDSEQLQALLLPDVDTDTKDDSDESFVTQTNGNTLFTESLEEETICEVVPAVNCDPKGDSCDTVEMDSKKSAATVEWIGSKTPIRSRSPLFAPSRKNDAGCRVQREIISVLDTPDEDHDGVSASTDIVSTSPSSPAPVVARSVQEQEKIPRRASILTALGGELSKSPLTKAKDPAVMMELMMIMKEQRMINTATSGNSDINDDINDDYIPSNGNHKDNTCDRYARKTPTPVNISGASTGSSMACISYHEKKSFIKLQEMRRNKLKQSQSVNANTSNSSIRRRSTTYTVDYFSGSHSSSAPEHHPIHSQYLSPFWQESSSYGSNISDQQHRYPSGRLSPSVSAPIAIPTKAANVLYDMGYPLYRSTSTPDFSISTPASTTSKSISASTSMTSLLSSQPVSPSLSAVSTPRSMSTTSLHSSFPECLFTSPSPSPTSSSRTSMRPSASPVLWTSSPPRRRTSAPSNVLPVSSRLPRDVMGTNTAYVAGSPLLAVPRRILSKSESWESIPTESQKSMYQPHQQQQRQRQNSYPSQGQFWKALQKQEYDDNNHFNSGRSGYQNFGELDQESCSSVEIQVDGVVGADEPQMVPSVETDSDEIPTSDYVSHQPSDYHSHQPQDDTHLSPGGCEYYYPRMSQPRYHQQDQHQYQQQDHRRGRPSREHDISMLTKRLANLQLMDSLCPGKSPQYAQPQSQQQPPMDAAWASQIQQLIIHLSEQTDLEDKAVQPRISTSSSSLSSTRSGNSSGNSAGANAGANLPIGIYEIVLNDWVQRLDQVSDGAYKDHPGLKREVEKIRWQHGIAKKSPFLKSY